MKNAIIKIIVEINFVQIKQDCINLIKSKSCIKNSKLKLLIWEYQIKLLIWENKIRNTLKFMLND